VKIVTTNSAMHRNAKAIDDIGQSLNETMRTKHLTTTAKHLVMVKINITQDWTA
jgi:hypothetical protein